MLVPTPWASKCLSKSILSLQNRLADPLVNSLNRLPFCLPRAVLGTPDVDQGDRGRYDRSGLRYESALTDEECAEIASLLPPANQAATSDRSISAK